MFVQVSMLIDGLSDEQQEVRRQCGYAIGQLAYNNQENQTILASRGAIDPLLLMLEDEHMQSRCQAAFALGWLAYENSENQGSNRLNYF